MPITLWNMIENSLVLMNYLLVVIIYPVRSITLSVTLILPLLIDDLLLRWRGGGGGGEFYIATGEFKFHKQKVSPTLPVKKAYSVQVEKKKQRFDILDQIPEAKAILAWKLAQHSKKKKSMIAPNKPTSKLVNPSMSFSLFKFKQGCHCKPKNVNRRTKKKKKGQGQPLGLQKQQLYKYHHPIIYSLVYPGDEPILAIIVDPIIVPPSKITFVSPSLLAVFIDNLYRFQTTKLN